MNAEGEPFGGTWRFSPRLSNLSTPAPQSWIQEISAGLEDISVREQLEDISVREQIVRTDGTEIVLRVRARFDGADYPVDGSPAVDTIAYTRTNRNTISAIGKKNGTVSLTESVLADPHQRTLTLTYNYVIGERIVAHGVAVFQSA
jgi:hypothetical protein